jgi:hypothetical protein
LRSVAFGGGIIVGISSISSGLAGAIPSPNSSAARDPPLGVRRTRTAPQVHGTFEESRARASASAEIIRRRRISGRERMARLSARLKSIPVASTTLGSTRSTSGPRTFTRVNGTIAAPHETLLSADSSASTTCTPIAVTAFAIASWDM